MLYTCKMCVILYTTIKITSITSYYLIQTLMFSLLSIHKFFIQILDFNYQDIRFHNLNRWIDAYATSRCKYLWFF